MITWAYLCTDPRKLRVTAKFALPWLVDASIDWVVCISADYPTAGEVRTVAGSINVPVLEIEDYFPDYNSDRWMSTFFGQRVTRERLGPKLTLPAHFAGHNLLYTDDDIVVQRDPTSLFSDRPRMSFVHTSGYREEVEQDRIEVATWSKIAGVAPLSVDEFNAVRADAAVAYFGQVDAQRYLVLAQQFIDAMLDLDLRGHRCRMLDQRMWTMWNYVNGGSLIVNGQEYRSMFPTTPPKKLPPNTFLHYAVGKHKSKYVDWLEGL